MLNKENIIELIRTNKSPVWILRGRRYAHDMQMLPKGGWFFEGKGTGRAKADDDDPDGNKLVTEAVINESINKFVGTLELIKNEPVFSYVIEMMPANNSPTHRRNTYEFTLDGNAAGATQTQSMAGIPQQYATEQSMAGMGYVSKEYLDQKLNLERDRYQLEFERRMLEADKQQLKAEMEKKEAEIKEMRETVGNNTKQLGNAFVLGIGSIVDAITGGKFNTKQIAQQIAGIQPEPEATETTTDETPQQKEAERLAEYVYNNLKGEDEIKAFTELSIKMVDNFKEQMKTKKEQPQNTEE
jgi:hypothetical protein